MRMPLKQKDYVPIEKGYEGDMAQAIYDDLCSRLNHAVDEKQASDVRTLYETMRGIEEIYSVDAAEADAKWLRKMQGLLRKAGGKLR